MFRLDRVSKRYGQGDQAVWAVREVSLEIHAGSFVSIMGPSGSGKSTLLHLMSALDTPSEGRIYVEGRDLGSLDDDALTLFRRRRVGLIFQFFNLLPSLTAFENVLFVPMLDRRPTAEDRAHAMEVLDQVGLGDRAHRRPSELSGGEMQRVAIARAMMASPAVVLADEPTGNLDSTNGRAVLELLRRFQQGRGCTVVMVTHDRGAAAIGDRLIQLQDGRVIDDQPVGEAA